MGDSELSLIRYMTINFFQVLLYSRPLYPTSTLLIKLVEALLSAESEPEEEIKKKVDWIYENTHKLVMKPLSIVEYAVYTNIQKSFNLNREIEIGGKSYFIIELYKYLNEIEKELTQIVVKISSKYSFEIPMGMMMGMGSKTGDSQSISITE
jgi:hypothetical protein